MPELPEVQTTVDGLNKTVKGRKILDVWTDYRSGFHAGKDNIKNPAFFKTFKKQILGTKIIGAKRRGKNVLIELSNNKTILVHMKMTGHLLFGKFVKENNKWTSAEKGPLTNSFNRFLHLVLELSGGKELALSDMRKFAKVTLIDTGKYEKDKELAHLGPDALELTFPKFKELIKKEVRPIKQVLIDQEILAGVGNIYSDEALWLAGIHPRSKPICIPDNYLKKLFGAMKKVLRKGINFGGDSMSDYRNIYGKPGKFQQKHNAYRKTGEGCNKLRCKGKIKRDRFGGRSAHFCPVHQRRFT